jgi:transcriptional regulator of NAD metabolism
VSYLLKIKSIKKSRKIAVKLTKEKSNKKVNKAKLAKNLGVCRQSLYYKPKLPAKDLELKKQIEEVLVEHKAYGHKRIVIHLGINKKRILRVMKLFNLSPARKPSSEAQLGSQEFQLKQMI